MKAVYIFLLCMAVSPLSLMAQQGKINNDDTTITFKVYGVCDLCKQRIETSLKIKGVLAANWNVNTKMLTVSYNSSKTSLKKINNIINEAGHDTYYQKAKDANYYALPKCCYYRQLETPVSTDTMHDASLMKNDTVQSSSAIIRGVVLEEDNTGSFKPLAGASIIWLDTHKGTTTNENGVFEIKKNGERLVISYTGFASDTISADPNKELKIIMASGKQLQEVRVTTSSRPSYIKAIDVYRTQITTQKELFKAACCNLSESFETNPSVDVSYNDAVTGSKQIQLLGLAGIYTQLTIENLPGPRGIATPLGLNYIPGSWIESIQMSKGTGSVANGFESIAGQINVELKKPSTSERLFVNAYVNDFGKTDLNINASQKIGKKWATELLVHNDFLKNKTDDNKDGFKDLPTGNLFTIENKWSFDNNEGWISQFGVRTLSDNKTGGQLNFNASKDKFTTNSYGIGINTNRYEAFGKMGYVFPGKKYKSIGLQLSAYDHQQHSYFGLTRYNAHQQNFYSNLIYQSIIRTTMNKFRTGLSFVHDVYNENFKTNNYKRTESVPGAFFEYTFTPSTKFDLVAGIREDYNNIYGWFTTPKLNVRYQPFKNTVIRASAGRGQRTANIFAENNSVFISSRNVQIVADDAKGAYGLQPEVSWNKGISFDQKFQLFNKAANLGIDFFRNDFINQVVVDLEDPRYVKFYNLHGKSYSNSLQTDFSFTPFAELDVKLAYRLFDVKTMYSGTLREKPLIAKDRAFASLHYEIRGWKFDYTVAYNGKKRLPSTASNPSPYHLANYSASYITMNAQVSKSLGKKNVVDIYLGSENITNFIQKNAIIAANDPFGNYFDASVVWGPITGRMFYGGVRYTIK